MNHAGTKTLETKRLILRRFTLDDAQAMYENWASDPAVTAFLRWPPHKSVNVSRGILEEWISQYDKPAYYSWGIVFKESGGLVGSIGAVDVDEAIHAVSVGYCIGKRWWRQGITSEALGAVIDFLFHVVEVNRIEAVHDPDNPGSGKVMEKCGLRYEGTLRQAGSNYAHGIRDIVIRSILREEYSGL